MLKAKRKAKRGNSKGYYMTPSQPRGGKFLTYPQVEKVCERCGKAFTVRAARGKTVCYDCVEKALQPKPCERCGRILHPTNPSQWKAFERKRLCRSCVPAARWKETE